MTNIISDQETRLGKFRCVGCGNTGLMDIDSSPRICERCIAIKIEKSASVPAPNNVAAKTHRVSKPISTDNQEKKDHRRMRYRLLMADGRDFHISAQMYADYTAIGLFKLYKLKSNIKTVVLSTCKHVNQYDQLRAAPSDHLQAKIFRNGDLMVKATYMDTLPSDVAWQLRSRLGDLIRDRGQNEPKTNFEAA